MLFTKKKTRTAVDLDTEYLKTQREATAIRDAEKAAEERKKKQEETESMAKELAGLSIEKGKKAVLNRISYLSDYKGPYSSWGRYSNVSRYEERILKEWLKENLDEEIAPLEKKDFTIEHTKFTLLNFDMMDAGLVPPVIEEETFYVPTSWVKRQLLYDKNANFDNLDYKVIKLIFDSAKRYGLVRY